MLLSKEYVGYLARQVTQKLIAGDFIETKMSRQSQLRSTMRCWKSCNLKIASMTRSA